METRRSIQDIQPSGSNNRPDVKLEKTTKKRVKKAVEAEPIPEKLIIEDMNIQRDNEIVEKDINLNNNLYNKKTINFKRILKMIGYIKPFYLITFTIIIVAVIILIFVPGRNKDPMEQNKKEAEMVKKELSKHMILPKDEDLDIRKITNKVEDPFFKDAQIGDYLILFYKNRIAYIYSVDKDLIINAGVIFIDPKTATTTKSQ